MTTKPASEGFLIYEATMTTYYTDEPLGSSSAKVLYDNAQNFDHLSNDQVNELWKDRFGVDRLTWHGMEVRYKEKLSSMGWKLIDSFQGGATLTEADQALRWVLPDGDGEYYRWDGALPKDVPAGSTPETTGGIGAGAWIGIGDAALRSDIRFSSENSFRSNARALNEKVESVRFCTWNIWGYGSTYNYFQKDITSKERVLWLKNVFLETSADVLGMQEVWSNAELTSNDYVVYPYNSCNLGMVYDQGRGWLSGNAILSRFNVLSTDRILYTESGNATDSEPRGFMKSVISIDGNNISCYNTHLSTSDQRYTLEITQLYQYVVNDENEKVVITADWNMDDTSLLAPFINIGFTLVNDHEFNTNNTGGSWYIDMILHRGFSEKSSGVVDVPIELSDHKLLYVDLEV